MEVVGDVVPDDDAAGGERAERAQHLRRRLAVLPEELVREAVHADGLADRALRADVVHKLSLDAPIGREPHARDLDDLVARRIDARRLDVEDNDVLRRACLDETREGISRLARERVEIVRNAHASAAVRLRGDRADGRGADAAREASEHAQETHGIMAVHRELEERERVLDLLPPEEARIVDEQKRQRLALRIAADGAELRR